MILFVNHLRAIRRRILIGLPVLTASVGLSYLSARFSLETIMSSPHANGIAFEHFLRDIQHPLFASLIYTPVFVFLISPLLNYVRSPQLILRIGGVGRSFRQALSISLIIAALYSVFLLALMLAVLVHSGVKTPEGLMFVAFLFALYLGYFFYFFSCSILMLVVYALSGRKANISITFVLAYGLIDYLGAIFGGSHHAAAFPIGWACIENITTGVANAIGAIIHILCFCIVGCLILYLISENFDCLSERQVDCRA